MAASGWGWPVPGKVNVSWPSKKHPDADDRSAVDIACKSSI
jgi:hypothetical protein